MRTLPLFLAAILLLTAIARPAAALLQGEEKLAAGGILKSITIPEGGSLAFVDVQAVIDAPMPAVWKALKEIERWPSWLPMSRKAKVLSPAAAARITPEVAEDQARVLAIETADAGGGANAREAGRFTRMVYEEYDLPWPIHNEWVIRNYTYEEDAERDRATWRKVASTDGRDDGSWEVSARPDGKTLLHYTYRVKAKEGVPQPVFKAAVSLTIGSMVKALRREAVRVAQISR